MSNCSSRLSAIWTAWVMKDCEMKLRVAVVEKVFHSQPHNIRPCIVIRRSKQLWMQHRMQGPAK